MCKIRVVVSRRSSRVTSETKDIHVSRDLRSSGKLCGLLALEDGTDRLSRNVGKDYHYTLRNCPEERRFHLQGDTKKRELLKTPTKIEEIQEKKIIDRN